MLSHSVWWSGRHIIQCRSREGGRKGEGHGLVFPNTLVILHVITIFTIFSADNVTPKLYVSGNIYNI